MSDIVEQLGDLAACDGGVAEAVDEIKALRAVVRQLVGWLVDLECDPYSDDADEYLTDHHDAYRRALETDR